MIDNVFSPKRFGLYLKKDFFLNLKNILIASGTLFGLLLMIYLLGINEHRNQESYQEFLQILYTAGLLCGGLIYTSTIFKDLNQQGKSYFFLTLPVSTFEKFLGAFTFSALGWSLFYTLIFFLFAGVAGEIQSIYYQAEFQFFDFGAFPLHQALMGYIIVQALFLLGAAFFKGKTFIKTGLALFLIGMICFFLFFFINWIVLNDFLKPDYHNFMNAIAEVIHQGSKGDRELFLNLANSVAKYAVAPLAWVLTYFKLKEREI